MIVKNNINVNMQLKYLLIVLNSKLSHFYSNMIINSLSSNTTIAQKNIIVSFPIPKMPKILQKPFEDLVGKILIKKERGETTTAEDQQIDLKGYKLYELTYDKVKIVDPEFDFSKEEHKEFIKVLKIRDMIIFFTKL